MHKMNPTIDFDFTITRSKRKTVSLIIDRNGTIRVLAPIKYSDQNINQFVSDKQEWIRKKMLSLEVDNKKRPTFKEGSHIEFMGSTLRIAYHIVKKKSDGFICLEDNVIYYNRCDFTSDAMLKDTERWYRLQAIMLFQERVAHFGAMMDRKPTKVSIKTQHKRWGSCTSKGHILLNWRLILAPIEVIDYVILHELCHLYHMDHSKRFWDLVSSIDPQYSEKKLWLKQHGSIILWPYEA